MYNHSTTEEHVQYQAPTPGPPQYSQQAQQQNPAMYQQNSYDQPVGAYQSFESPLAPPPLFSRPTAPPTPPYGNVSGYPLEKGHPAQQAHDVINSQHALPPMPQPPPFHSGQEPLPTPPNENSVGYPPEKVEKMLQSLSPDKLHQLKQQIQASANAALPFGSPPTSQTPAPPTGANAAPTVAHQPSPNNGAPNFAPQPAPNNGAPTFAPPPTSHNPLTPGAKGKDQQDTTRMKRILGDSVVGRLVRSGVRTATTAMKMPESLSPWGDNNPITLPNVRYRDAVLMAVCHGVAIPLADGVAGEATSLFGADAFISEVINSSAGTLVTHVGAVMMVRMALDSVTSLSSSEEERILTTTTVKSLQVQIKHKLMGVDADIRFNSVYPAADTKSCSKGWFCPYLFASARTPAIPRANDFAIAQCFGPFLAADYAMAHKLVAESTHILPLCDPNPKTDIRTNRMVITFAGISPYRGGNGMWSTSRRPGCGMLHFHLFDGVPAIVIPVNERAPIVAWSPWTLAQMQTGLQMQNGGFVAEIQHEQVCEWLDGLISIPHVKPEARERYVDVLARGVSLIINGALCLDSVSKTVLGKIDAERAGIVMFRY